jgi:hypothetical protein
MASLAKAFALLNPGGYLVCIINNTRGAPDYVKKMLDRVREFDDIEYLGVIAYAEKRASSQRDINHNSTSKQQTHYHGRGRGWQQNNQRHNYDPTNRTQQSEYYYKSPQPMWIWRKNGEYYADFSYLQTNSLGSLKEQINKDAIICDYGSIPTKNYLYYGCASVGDSFINDIRNYKNCNNVTGGIDDILNSSSDSNGNETTTLTKYYQIYKPNVIIPNPPIVITEHKYSGKTFKVVRDDMLPGGTKQRAIGVFSGDAYSKYTEFVYAGPWNGYAQVALAMAANVLGKRATIFMTRRDYATNVRAQMYGAKIVVCKEANLWQLQQAAAAYVERINGGTGSVTSTLSPVSRHSALLLPFGFDSEEFRVELSLKIALAATEISSNFAGTIWVAGGSGTIATILAGVFASATIAVVQVGKKIDPAKMSPNTKLYVAKEHFYEDCVTQPPYPSAIKYDAKVWQFARDGRDGDIIWNVAG